MDLIERTRVIREEVIALLRNKDIDQLVEQKKQLQSLSEEPDFWKDRDGAQTVMKKLATIKEDVQLYQQLDKDSKDLVEITEIADDSLEKDIKRQIETLQGKLDKLKHELAFSGPYDGDDAIITISSGAGGTDAQDWAAILFRMYVRWAEKEGFKVAIEDESPGEEAGIKSAQIMICGRLAYGRLRAEHGVHRLVRLSPFNANNLRQTSFAKVEVLPRIEKPELIPIDEQDLRIDVFRSGGHGGQSVNTTDSAVRVTHLPTNIVVTIQNERSQIQNRETALTILRSKLALMQLEQHANTIKDLKGPNLSAEWGNQIRSYVMHPYSMVKDLRTRHETSNIQAVLDGDINGFLDAEKSLDQS